MIDQSVIGSCTNGRIEDLRCAAEILKGRKVKKGVRCIIIPATQNIYLQAMDEGLLKIFIEAGAVVSTPTCGPCLGGYMGILAEGERCIPPQTETLWDVWDTWTLKYIWQARLWLRQAQ